MSGEMAQVICGVIELFLEYTALEILYGVLDF